MDANKIVCDKTYKELDENQIDIVKIETMESKQNFNPQNIDLNFVEVPSLEAYHSNTATKLKRRRRNCKKSQSLALPKHGYPMDSKLILKDRFRPIRPKPLRLSASKHKFELPMNVTTLSSNSVIVHNTVPIKKKFRYIIPSDVSNKMKNNHIESNSSNSVNNINNSNTVNIQLETEEDKIEIQDSKTATRSYCNINGNSNTNVNSNNSKNISYSNCNKDLHSIKTTSKSHPNKNSIELFFESMAQTVLNLPNEVQAEIKMQICKIVTNAEIRYCESQAKIKTKN